MSVAGELESLRNETRLLREHVRRLAHGPGSGVVPPVVTSPKMAWWREDQPGWLLALAAVAGCTVGAAASLAAVPWIGTTLAAGLGSAVPILVRAAGRFLRQR